MQWSYLTTENASCCGQDAALSSSTELSCVPTVRLFSSLRNEGCDNEMHQDWRVPASFPLGMLDKLKSLAEGKKKNILIDRHPLKCARRAPLWHVSQQPCQMPSKAQRLFLIGDRCSSGTLTSWHPLTGRYQFWREADHTSLNSRDHSEITDVEQLG